MTTYTFPAASSKSVFAAIPRDTVKGEAIARLAIASYGSDEVAVLRLAADAVDRELITVGRDAYQIVVINTDTTANSTVLDSTSAADVVETVAAHGLTRGAVLRCESEFLLVKEVRSVNTLLLQRGYAGSTIASHADATDIFRKGAAALTAGKIVLPVASTLTPAAAGPQLATGMTALGTLGWTFTYTANTLTGFRTANGVHDTLSETLGGVNNVWAAAASWGGIEAAGQKRGLAMRVPTAAEVALGALAVKFPFTPTFVRITVFTTATAAPVAWNGAYAVNGGVVTLDNSSTTDWSVAETVVVEAFGN